MSSTQKAIRTWFRNASYLLFFATFATCIIDISGLSERGHLTVSSPIYFGTIAMAVALQILAAVIPNMKFAQQK